MKWDLRVSSKRFAAATFLTSGTLAWFFLIQFYISDIFVGYPPSPFLASTNPILFYGFGALSAVAGSLIGRKSENRKFLLLWITLGVLSTATLPLFQQTMFMPFASILLGLSLGLGLPNSMAFIADCTVIEERARIAGTTILGTFFLAFLAMIAARLLGFGLSSVILLFALVRSTSFLALILDKCDRKTEEEKKAWLSRPDYKDFVFYLFPWMMFILVAMLAWNLIPTGAEYASAISMGNTLRFACIAFFGLVSGVVADRFGRKQAIIIGLIVLGISFAILGFAMSPLGVIIYLTTSGIAWGLFLATYLVIPGDLSNFGSRKKFYALITILPLILLGSVPFMGLTQISDYSSSFSQILSLILFLSIIPVLRAKETLPESSIRERKLREHVKKIGKLVEESSEPE